MDANTNSCCLDEVLRLNGVAGCRAQMADSDWDLYWMMSLYNIMFP